MKKRRSDLAKERTNEGVKERKGEMATWRVGEKAISGKIKTHKDLRVYQLSFEIGMEKNPFFCPGPPEAGENGFLTNPLFFKEMNKNHPYHDQSMWKGASPKTFSNAQKLRETMTEAEKVLWGKLCKNQLYGYKFRRQHPIHKFIADFYCHKLKLIIEIDGEYHNNETQRKLDEDRTKLLENQGLKIIRFTNEEVLNDIDMVLQKLTSVCMKMDKQSKKFPATASKFPSENHEGSTASASKSPLGKPECSTASASKSPLGDLGANTPHQNYTISKSDRRKANGHNSLLLWFTGLSGSGKSTLANMVEVELHKKGMKTYVLDGDNIRRGINSDLDFTPKGRSENLRRIAEVAKLFVDSGTIVLAAFVSPMKKDREKIAQIVGTENFVEIFVNASIEECEKRDVKGLYQKARSGEIKNFTGISAPYEPPENADVVVNSDNESIEKSVERILSGVRDSLIR